MPSSHRKVNRKAIFLPHAVSTQIISRADFKRAAAVSLIRAPTLGDLHDKTHYRTIEDPEAAHGPSKTLRIPRHLLGPFGGLM